MIPSVGRIVHYRLSAKQALETNERRLDKPSHYHGNFASEGDVYPMLIVRLWTEAPDEESVVQGQVFLDGNDTLWTTSVKQGTEVGQWSDPRS